MARKALGRGLSALLPESPVQTQGEALQEVDLDLIDPNRNQPRTSFDAVRLNELAQSIKSSGIVQPLLVRRMEGRYQLIAGERRWRASQIAGLTRVPVIVRDIPDERLLEIALIENIQRQDLNPIDEAKAYRRLMESSDLTQDQLAEKVGRDRASISNYLRLLRLAEPVRAFVEEERLSVGHAKALLAITDHKIQTEVATRIIRRGLSVRETEKAIKKLTVSQDQRIPLSMSVDPNLRAAEVKLRRNFSTAVRILPNHSKPGGKIEIEYYDETDLNRVFSLLLHNSENH